MSTGSKKRTRSERVASVELPPGMWGHLRTHLRRGHVLVRIAICAVAAIALWVITQGWVPPQSFHLGDIPQRDVTSRTQFEKFDEQATDEARQQARKLAVAVYDSITLERAPAAEAGSAFPDNLVPLGSVRVTAP